MYMYLLLLCNISTALLELCGGEEVWLTVEGVGVALTKLLALVLVGVVLVGVVSLSVRVS